MAEPIIKRKDQFKTAINGQVAADCLNCGHAAALILAKRHRIWPRLDAKNSAPLMPGSVNEEYWTCLHCHTTTTLLVVWGPVASTANHPDRSPEIVEVVFP